MDYNALSEELASLDDEAGTFRLRFRQGPSQRKATPVDSRYFDAEDPPNATQLRRVCLEMRRQYPAELLYVDALVKGSASTFTKTYRVDGDPEPTAVSANPDAAMMEGYNVMARTLSTVTLAQMETIENLTAQVIETSGQGAFLEGALEGASTGGGDAIGAQLSGLLANVGEQLTDPRSMIDRALDAFEGMPPDEQLSLMERFQERIASILSRHGDGGSSEP